MSEAHRASAAPTVSPLASARERWLTLTSLTLVTFLLLLDDTAVAVALPSVQRDLDMGMDGLEWVVNAYTLVLAALTLLAGRLADRDGRRRVFLLGLTVFAMASAVSGLAPTGGLLIAARALQGVGGALIGPASLAIIAATFSERERGVAIGIWAGVSASALGLGPLVGAAITDSAGWRWIFLLNVPLGIGAWLIARTLVRESRANAPPRRLDLLGVSLSGTGLFALLLALTRTNAAGWGSSRTIALFVVAAVCFAIFVRNEAVVPEPLVDLSLFRDRSFAGANIQILLATSVMCSLFFFLSLYLQVVLGYSALATGVSLLPLTATTVVIGPLAGQLADRIGARTPVVVGMVLLAVALFGMSGFEVDSQLWALAPWLTLAGMAIGLVTSPTTTAALDGTDSGSYGEVAGMFSTFRTTGLTLGVAVMGAILASFGRNAAFGRDFDRSHHAAFVDGFSTAVTINGVVAMLAAVLAVLMLDGSTRS